MPVTVNYGVAFTRLSELKSALRLRRRALRDVEEHFHMAVGYAWGRGDVERLSLETGHATFFASVYAAAVAEFHLGQRADVPGYTEAWELWAESRTV